jgi:hypothetical protein
VGSTVGPLDNLWRPVFCGRDSDVVIYALVIGQPGTLGAPIVGWWSRFHSEREHFCVRNAYRCTALLGP